MASHIKPKQGEGLRWVVKRKLQDLLLIDFGLINLREGTVLRDGTKDEEAILYLFGGTCSVSGEEFNFKSVGVRKDVFDGKASAVYIPPFTQFAITALTDLSAAIVKAPATAAGSAQHISPRDVKVRKVGRDNWAREVHDVGVDNLTAQKLVVGETFNPPGNWSSSPPHKHDIENPPDEGRLEELYFYRLRPAQGFGLQRIYTGDGYNQVFVVEDGDAVTIPRGYHPIVAAPGYELYYFWVLASFHERKMRVQDDPKHRWLKDAR
jgi:5-deoxy-glucuronate isomerase